MLSIEKMKKLLPKEDKNLSDEEIIKIRDKFYELGQLIFDVWLDEKNKKSPNYIAISQKRGII